MEQLIKDLCERNREEIYAKKPFLVPTKKFERTDLKYGDWLWMEKKLDQLTQQTAEEIMSARLTTEMGNDFVSKCNEAGRQEALSAVRQIVDGMRESEVCENPDDCPYCGRNMYCRGHSDEIAHNQALDDLLTQLQANNKDV